VYVLDGRGQNSLDGGGGGGEGESAMFKREKRKEQLVAICTVPLKDSKSVPVL
jgi:hypothetical protein